MPEIKYYEIEQSRVVMVAANNEVDALAIATKAFATNNSVASGEESGEPWGHTLGNIEVTNVTISRELI
jgi:hypothetical protein